MNRKDSFLKKVVEYTDVDEVVEKLELLKNTSEDIYDVFEKIKEDGKRVYIIVAVDYWEEAVREGYRRAQ